MSEEVYVQAKSRIRSAFDACDWSDDVGKAFEGNLMPNMFQGLERLNAVESEIDKLMRQIEEEFP